ncbi:early nodulin-like protein 3 [Vicia villosa]|uniref:early nodulin-like protein 3 n=1 Tax=Vicia villosa TaxID=3911 RepID=UPI00273ACC8B|nr:early nodulin-like protein 3 [Vicia villosa]
MVSSSALFLGLMFLLTPLLLLSSSSQALEFHVGGKDGWDLKPFDYYNNWAQRNRFQVNDTLNFKYNKKSDSVLVVKKEDYDSCNINHPEQKMDNGDSSFKLCHSGLYFFISGNVDHCKQGQKLIVLVMAVRHRNPPPTVVAVPSPVSGVLPPLIHKSALDAPAPSPSKASSVGFGVVVWVGLMFSGFVY